MIDTLSRHQSLTAASAWGCWLLLACAPAVAPVHAGEFHFVADEYTSDRVIWQPSLALLDVVADLKGDLVFVLRNDSDTPHEFAAHGLSEVFDDDPNEGESTPVRPLAVVVPPKQVHRVRVDKSNLQPGRHFQVRDAKFAKQYRPGLVSIVDGTTTDIP